MTKYRTPEAKRDAKRKNSKRYADARKKNPKKYKKWLSQIKSWHQKNYVPHPKVLKTPEELKAKRVATSRAYRISPRGIMMRHAYHQTPKFKKWNREYMQKYRKLDKWKEYIKEYWQRPEVKARQKQNDH